MTDHADHSGDANKMVDHLPDAGGMVSTDHATRAREIVTEWKYPDVRPEEHQEPTEAERDGLELLIEMIAVALAQAAQPVWSDKLPAIAGTYWYRKNKEHDLWIADVYEIDGQLTTTLGGSVKDMGGEWAGPLPLPREA